MFYLVDKPLGISSFDVLRKMRKVLNIRKMGHTGTLDPLATGLLLVATGNSTKLIAEIDKCVKRYRFTVRLDGRTDSLDLGTPIERIDASNAIRRSVDECRAFLMRQTRQIPPKYSALHINGERAYTLARLGKEFELEERSIAITDVEIHVYAPPEEIEISLTISSGGYIRSLAPTIGGFFGIEGGYISQLRRIGLYLHDGTILDLRDACTLDNLTSISYDHIFPTIHTINISNHEYLDLLNGKSISPTQGLDPNIENRYFLQYAEDCLSLCGFDGEKFIIIRNQV